MQKQDVISIDYLEDAARFADLLNGYIYHGREVIHEEDIREVSRSVARIARQNKQSDRNDAQVVTADIVREVANEMRVVVIALENQTDIHYAMPIRVMNLESANYHRQWRKKAKYHRQEKDISGAEYISGFSKTDQLIPTITIVVYFGKEPWDGPKSLSEMMDMEGYPSELRGLVEDYHIHLLEVRRFSNLERFRTDLQYVFGFLQNEDKKEDLSSYVQANKSIFEELREDAYDMISVMSHSSELNQYKRKFQNEEGGFNMCRAIDDMIEHGKQNARMELMMRMFHDGKITLCDACAYIELTEEEFLAEEKKYGE